MESVLHFLPYNKLLKRLCLFHLGTATISGTQTSSHIHLNEGKNKT